MLVDAPVWKKGRARRILDSRSDISFQRAVGTMKVKNEGPWASWRSVALHHSIQWVSLVHIIDSYSKLVVLCVVRASNPNAD